MSASHRDPEALLRQAAGHRPPPPKTGEPDANDYLRIATGHAPAYQPPPPEPDPERKNPDVKKGSASPPPPVKPDPINPNDLLRELAKYHR